MEIVVVRDKIKKAELKAIADQQFGNLVKAAVDVERRILAVGGELHADEEAVLLHDGSKQEQIWGINLYLERSPAEWIEFDSMINIRPSQGNKSRGIEDESIRELIKSIIAERTTS
ncbi:MAG: hypothetical protein HY220_02815 [Candidatus Sungbacteria bacterium]|uniref:Uncharacterized protein n=1 Tax=Candidatus Sungiibacteriota bacterium TaxID=2750080 RepID=A0A9D6QU68_9BACT|nr:hypothetical protein [Candidatus Sungbacteria bacterium]